MTPGPYVGLIVLVAGFVITFQTKEFLHLVLTCVGAYLALVIVDWFWARVRGY